MSETCTRGVAGVKGREMEGDAQVRSLWAVYADITLDDLPDTHAVVTNNDPNQTWKYFDERETPIPPGVRFLLVSLGDLAGRMWDRDPERVPPGVTQNFVEEGLGLVVSEAAVVRHLAYGFQHGVEGISPE